MQTPFWLNRMAKLLGKPRDRMSLENQKLRNAKLAIQAAFGEPHKKAANTCCDVLNTLWILSEDKSKGLTGMTQAQIAQHCRWAPSTVGRYTRIMHDMGILRVVSPGRFQRNEYYFIFMDNEMARIVRRYEQKLKHYKTRYTFRFRCFDQWDIIRRRNDTTLQQSERGIGRPEAPG